MTEFLLSKPAESIVSILLGQLFSALVLLTGEPSLYQPGIYLGLKLFLVVPLMVGIIATWAVINWKCAMWVVFATFLVLVSIIFVVFRTLPPNHWLHPINWVLSYCASALVAAAAVRLTFDTLRSWRT